jgi:hypothetical protein
MMAIGNALFEDNKDFVCIEVVEVIPLNNSGATYLLFYTLLMLLFSFMMWCVFYKIPDNYGLIYKARANSVHIRDTNVINSVSLVVDEIKSINKQDDEILSSMGTPMLKHKTSKDSSPRSGQQRQDSDASGSRLDSEIS